MLTIETSARTVYSAKCDTCDHRFPQRFRKALAEYDMRDHECGVHREVMRSGEYRWWCDDFLRVCICGASYGSAGPSLPFACPKAVPLRESSGPDADA